ncbi:MAG TPA: hypothetical protein ENI79_00615 [Rhodospirillales bacterium]|nr:hypothetical protein [Rhodospirillales bacterium]
MDHKKKALLAVLFVSIGLAAIAIIVASGSSDQAVRDDAMKILMAEVHVNGVVDLCQKKAENNPRLIEAARQWSKRNRRGLNLAEDALIAAGNISGREKKIIKRVTLSFMRRDINRYADKAAYCRAFKEALESGGLDVNARKDTAPALQRLQDLPPDS